jgi:hypothetical protein
MKKSDMSTSADPYADHDHSFRIPSLPSFVRSTKTRPKIRKTVAILRNYKIVISPTAVWFTLPLAVLYQWFSNCTYDPTMFDF